MHIPSSLKFCRACQVVMEFYRRPGRKKIFIAEAGYISWDVNVMEISDMLYLIHLMLRKPCYCLWFSQLSIIGYAIIILVLMYPFGRSEFSGMLLSFAVLILLALSLKSKIIWLISYSNMVCFVWGTVKVSHDTNNGSICYRMNQEYEVFLAIRLCNLFCGFSIFSIY